MKNKQEEIMMQSEKKQRLLPKLRFPEFHSDLGWITKTLGEVATPITEKAGDKNCIPMSITSGVGLVSQLKKFGRIIAGSSYKNYFLLKKNDFAYNKSATKEYPEGFIALYSGEEIAAVPNSIFTCFRLNSGSLVPQYLNYLFLRNLHGRWLRKFIEVGARAHGSLSINDDDLFALPIPIPDEKSSSNEQQKIADCLTSLDEMMAAQSQKLAALKAHKKGLMQRLFPCEGETTPRLRFPEFRDAAVWKSTTLDSFLRAFSEKISADTTLPIYSSARTGLQLQKDYYDNRELTNDGQYGVVPKGFFVYRHMSDDGTFKFNINDTGKRIAVSKEYPVFSADGLYPSFLKYLLNEGDQFKKFAIEQKKGGTRTRLYLKVLRTFSPLLPTYEEQKNIGGLLSSLDDLITVQTNSLETLKNHKKGLMQQLFPTSDEVST